MHQPVFAAMLLVATAAHATPPPQHSQRRSGTVTPFDGKTLTKLAPLTGATGWQVTIAGSRPLATPAVDGGRVFVGGGFGSHEFYAFDEGTGQVAWSVRVSDDGPTAAVLADGKAIFNTESCTLFVVSAATGAPVWSEWLGDPLLSQPAAANGKVFMVYPAKGKHFLLALSLDTGAHLWQGELSGDAISAPIVEAGAVYVTTFDGTVYRFDEASGGLAWKRSLQATSAPWIVGSDIFVSQRDAGKKVPGPLDPPVPGGKAPPGPLEPPPPTENLRKLKISDGQVDGQLIAPKPAPYLDRRVQSRSAYMKSQEKQDSSVGFGGGAPASAKGEAAYRNVGQGTVNGMWEFQGSRPVAALGKLISSMGDEVKSVDQSGGATAWHVPVDGDTAKDGGHMAAPPAVVNGKVYVGTLSGHLLVLDLATGKRLRDVKVGHPIRFQPAIHNGRAYLGSANGQLLAVNLDDKSATGWTMWGGSASHNGPR